MWTHAEQSAFENFQDPDSDPSLNPQSSLWHFRSLDTVQAEVAALLFESLGSSPPSPAPRNKVWKTKRDIYARPIRPKPKAKPAARRELPVMASNWVPLHDQTLLGRRIDPDSITDSAGRWAHRPTGNGNYIFKKCGGRWLAKWTVPGISVRMVMLPADIWVRIIKKILTLGFTQFSPGTYQKGDLMIRTLNHLNDARWFFLEGARHKMPLAVPVMRPVKFHKVYRL